MKYRIRKKFIDTDRKEYEVGDPIDIDNSMKVIRMQYYGYIDWNPIKQKKRGRKPKIERAVMKTEEKAVVL